ncbi:hypothetical protein MHPYR_160089 [uncultured Mycobacterium sp.]|uniref:Uncharacterized protein n=1 Tax=uncultured Mycobacterium sp. TaxID=171292 RepID=A0A1Y5P3P1_9MYCO|nr:hypothetical protein MHPYR_160089 [uncultured Mycobacterium sp.]
MPDPGADVAQTEPALIHDSAGEFATRHRPGLSAVFAIRPDGYLCLVARDSPTQADLKVALKLTFRWPSGPDPRLRRDPRVGSPGSHTDR